VEDEVNRAILANEKVASEVMSHDEAVKKGATALFGEKYGDEVRVVQVPGVSMELCGGTHLAYTGQTGPFVILSETGVAAGIRRIEAATGWNALNQLQEERGQFRKAAALLKAGSGDIAERIQALQAEVKAAHKEMERLQAKLASGAGRDLLGDTEEINGVKVLAVEVEAPNVKIMREQMDALRSKLESGVIALAARHENGKVSLIVAVTKDLHGKFKAGDLVKQAAAEVGGGGGGRPDMAQAGGTNPEGIPAALAKIKELVAG
jgi:alanyl-tRNA synthetase